MLSSQPNPVVVRSSHRCGVRVRLAVPVVSGVLLAAALCVPGWGSDIPAPGDPKRLLDLRWLARPQPGTSVIIDTLSGLDTPADSSGQIVADIEGPGVLQHLICGAVGELQLTVDGVDVFRGSPHKAWPQVYVPPEPEERGALPFAFPLVHTVGLYAHCIVPLPFSDRLVVRGTAAKPEVWLQAQRLDDTPALRFSAVAGSEYMTRLHDVQNALLRPTDALPAYPDATRHDSTTECPALSARTLAALSGPAELVGVRLEVVPGALELLRYPVISVSIDGVTSLRMPLLDVVGVSHPWPHAWMPMAGDWVAGLVHPYRRSGGRVRRAAVVYWKLPIPFASGLRLDVRNRSADLPVVMRAELLTVPLTQATDPVARLCGVSRRCDLAAGRNALHVFPAGRGQLVGLSLFTTGHGRDWDWRKRSVALLNSASAEAILAQGPGLLPLALQGKVGNLVFGSMTWNHNSLEPLGRCGAGRHFWVDPLALPGNAELAYELQGNDGPARVEAAAVWYHFGPGSAPEAPRVPDQVVMLPPVCHGQARKPSSPDGWWLEAELLAACAETEVGSARSETLGASDAFASAGAYLGWNATRPGDVLDLLVDLPPTAYVQVWYHRLLFPAGGVFRIDLASVDDQLPRLGSARTPDDFRRRVLGQATSRASVDCHDVWPHRQAYRFEMPIMRNPAPGCRGRIRFTCATKGSASRGYLLALDQIGMDAAPRTPEGWRECESATVVGLSPGLTAEPMRAGRSDFDGWGGLALAAKTASRAELVLFDPREPVPTGILVIRGVLQSGEWFADAGTQSETRLDADADTKPVEWSVPLPDTAEAGPVTLTVHCRSVRGGELLLDAWTFRAHQR